MDRQGTVSYILKTHLIRNTAERNCVYLLLLENLKIFLRKLELFELKAEALLVLHFESVQLR